MASNTDTVTTETTPPDREPPRPPKARRGALTWAAVTGACIAVVALAVATLTGGNDDRDVPTPRFDPRAEQYERQAHLDGLARTYGQHAADTPAPTDEADTAGGREFVPGSRHMPAR